MFQHALLDTEGPAFRKLVITRLDTLRQLQLDLVDFLRKVALTTSGISGLEAPGEGGTGMVARRQVGCTFVLSDVLDGSVSMRFFSACWFANLSLWRKGWVRNSPFFLPIQSPNRKYLRKRKIRARPRLRGNILPRPTKRLILPASYVVMVDNDTDRQIFFLFCM